MSFSFRQVSSIFIQTILKRQMFKREHNFLPTFFCPYLDAIYSSVHHNNCYFSSANVLASHSLEGYPARINNSGSSVYNRD